MQKECIRFEVQEATELGIDSLMRGKFLRLLSRGAIESNLHFTSNYGETGVSRSQWGECFIINRVRAMV